MALIKIQNVCQQYESKEVLKDINLQVDKGEVFTLIGPTGAGKTTLIRILDLLEKPYSGIFYFDGVDITASHAYQLEARRRMAYVQQRPIVFAMNVYENIARGLRWRSINSLSIRKKVTDALELVGMADYRTRNAKTLSGGETQRVAIARAIITEPEVLFLDEPTANMDPVSTAKVEEVLADIIGQQKTTIIMTTHNMSQGQRMANRLGVIIDGKLLQTGSVNDIFNVPSSKEVAEFVGVENILRGEVINKQDELACIDTNGEQIFAVSNFNPGEKVYVLVRPEAVVFSLSSEAGSARNVFKCRVTKLNTIGGLVRIEAQCGFCLLGVITVQSAQDLNIALGKEVYTSFKATAIHVIKRWH